MTILGQGDVKGHLLAVGGEWDSWMGVCPSHLGDEGRLETALYLLPLLGEDVMPGAAAAIM